MTTKAAAKTIKVDIVSDTVCPWCYIGKKRLETAITSFKSKAENKEVEFEVNWHPYQLDPSASETPVPKMVMYSRKFGQDRAPLIRDRMIQVGKEEGIQFAYDGNIVNTLNSHRLIAYATKHGKQDEMVNQLFKDYFEENKCGEIDTLIDSAAKVGLDREKVAQFLKSDEGAQEIKAEINKAKTQGVQGVPFFTINGSYSCSGAQEPQTFEALFNKAA
ncbi:hypothetical protein BGX34_004416 [Mortierella sp. NVP85]|nr:hypothetical protein BGX34_004416 [Mortierella sp. NVP85]